MQDAGQAKSLRQAKRMAKRINNACIIFDRELCSGQYREILECFLPYGTRPFIPLKESWSNKEIIECINTGLAYVLEYACTSETIRESIEAAQAYKKFQNRN